MISWLFIITFYLLKRQAMRENEKVPSSFLMWIQVFISRSNHSSLRQLNLITTIVAETKPCLSYSNICRILIHVFSVASWRFRANTVRYVSCVIDVKLACPAARARINFFPLPFSFFLLQRGISLCPRDGGLRLFFVHPVAVGPRV